MGLGKTKIAPVAAVSNMNRAREFYEGKLGLRLKRESHIAELAYECGDGTELLVYGSPDHAGKSTATLAYFDVENLDLEMDRLAANGVVFEQYDQPGLKTNPRGVAELHGSRVAWFRDPDGNTYAISQG